MIRVPTMGVTIFCGTGVFPPKQGCERTTEAPRHREEGKARGTRQEGEPLMPIAFCLLAFLLPHASCLLAFLFLLPCCLFCSVSRCLCGVLPFRGCPDHGR